MKRLLWLLTVTAILLVACAGPKPTPTAGDMLKRAGDAMLAMKSAQFKLTREGAPVVLDEKNATTFSEATGQYQAPDRVSATLKVSLAGTLLHVDLLWLPEGNFISNPLTGVFEKAPADLPFNGVALFKASGISAVLKDKIQNPKLVGEEKLDDVDTYHLSGEVNGQELAFLSANAFTASGPYPVEVWIEKSTFNLVRVHIAEPNGDGWLIEMFDIGKPVEIKAP